MRGIITNVTDVTTRSGPGHRFNFTVYLDENDLMGITFKGCLTGTNKSYGHWVQPPMSTTRSGKQIENIEWTGDLQDWVKASLVKHNLTGVANVTQWATDASKEIEL